MGYPSLIYQIATRSLRGKLGETEIDIEACGAGGHAGTRTKGLLNLNLANNMASTYLQDSKKTPGGGPLPAVRYVMTAHETKHDGSKLHCVWLDPEPASARLMGGRAGMMIHGRGKIGSEGCIVLEKDDLDTVWNAVNKNPGNTLEVVGAIGDFELRRRPQFG